MEELSPDQVRQLVRREVTKATAPRVSREHIRLLKVGTRHAAPTACCCRTPSLQLSHPSPRALGPFRHQVVGSLSRNHLPSVPCCCQVLDEPYSPEAGTLTRTMKPRRAAILKHYANDVKALIDQL